ncbi:fatty acid-binding protein-like [Dermatophagoides pteronyssinus]|uniref:Fatty acid-binding protein-like n=1 Tax=Dermatophagoides pteronyssinus TaxID=6956 RepID=A0A6P6Y9H2_DERPT|nr:fatty acid-binding protein-like [Dermatophagoides pteronyssinus]
MWFSNLIDIENWKRRMVTITESNDSNQQQQQSKNDEQQQQNFEQHVVPDKFYGRYRLTTSDNFDAFLREIGVGFLARKLANLTRPHLEIVKEPNGYIAMKVEAPHKTLVNRFRINEYFNETRMDGKVCKSIVEFIPPNKFIQMQWDNGLEIKYIREFVDNKINVKSICNNIQSFRVYTRVE